MKYLSQLLATILVVVPWLAGLVLAQGFWSTLFEIWPPYAWYLAVERAMQIAGWVS